jgi:hypothetical protein
MVLVQDATSRESIANSSSQQVAQVSLMREFLERDNEFNFVQRPETNVTWNRNNCEHLRGPRIEEVIQFGRQYAIDYLILGNAETNVSDVKVFDTIIQTAQATLSAKILRASTGEIVGASHAKGEFAPVVEREAGRSAATSIASRKLANELIPLILNHWRKELSGVHKIVLIVYEIEFNELPVLENLLQVAVGGITKLDRMEFAENEAVYQLQCRNTANQLAEEMDGRTIKQKSMIIKDLVPGRIVITLK